MAMRESDCKLQAHARGNPRKTSTNKTMQCEQKRACESESPSRSGPSHWSQSNQPRDDSKLCRRGRTIHRADPAHWLREKCPSWQPAAGLQLLTGRGRKGPSRRPATAILLTYYSTSSAASAQCSLFEGSPTWTGASDTKVVEPVHGRSRTL